MPSRTSRLPVLPVLPSALRLSLGSGSKRAKSKGGNSKGNLTGIPIADHVTGFARGWDRDGTDWLAPHKQPGTTSSGPSEPPPQPVAIAA